MILRRKTQHFVCCEILVVSSQEIARYRWQQWSNNNITHPCCKCARPSSEDTCTETNPRTSHKLRRWDMDWPWDRRSLLHHHHHTTNILNVVRILPHKEHSKLGRLQNNNDVTSYWWLMSKAKGFKLKIRVRFRSGLDLRCYNSR